MDPEHEPNTVCTLEEGSQPALTDVISSQENRAREREIRPTAGVGGASPM